MNEIGRSTTSCRYLATVQPSVACLRTRAQVDVVMSVVVEHASINTTINAVFLCNTKEQVISVLDYCTIFRMHVTYTIF